MLCFLHVWAGTAPPRTRIKIPAHASADEQIISLRQDLSQSIHPLMAGMLRKSLHLFSLELYSGPVRALWELLQNADDCSYTGCPCIRIVQSPDYVWLEYNEDGFSSEDVQALCNVGASTKHLGQTGQKGIGFKASFVLSSRPHVFSNPFRFYFDEEAPCPLPQVGGSKEIPLAFGFMCKFMYAFTCITASRTYILKPSSISRLRRSWCLQRQRHPSCPLSAETGTLLGKAFTCELLICCSFFRTCAIHTVVAKGPPSIFRFDGTALSCFKGSCGPRCVAVAVPE